MKTKFLSQVAILIFAALLIGIVYPAAHAQDANKQTPVIVVKIRDIEQFLSAVERLSPQAGNQLSVMRKTLQGTDWIDSDRSITAAITLDGGQSKVALLIPFRRANPGIQMMLNAATRKDYYIAAIPPQQKFEANPAMEERLANASREPVFGNITLEISPSRLLPLIESQMDAALKKTAEMQLPSAESAGMTPQDTQAVLHDMLSVLKQAEIIRFGIDLSGSILTLQYDVEAQPNSVLAGVLTDPQTDTRLMSFPSEMPFQFRSRAPNLSGATELAKLAYGRIYQKMGINIEDVKEITKYFTGEFAGGIKIDSNGLAMEAIYVLQPGIDGEAFLLNTYLPWFERYTQQISAAVSSKNTKYKGISFQRTPDSTVDGLKVIGMKENFKGLLPSEEDKLGILDKLSIEMRMAASKDLVFMASDDFKLANLIAKAHSLAKTPSQGPTTVIDIKLGSLIKGIASLFPQKSAAITLPENLSNISIKATMRNGKLISRTSINIDDILKLSGAFKPQTANK
jgi:hypothetical protein